MRVKTAQIRNFILSACRDKPASVTSETVNRFGITRQAVLRHIHYLEDAGLIKSTGINRSKRYQLVSIQSNTWSFQLSGLQEDLVWQKYIAPLMANLPDNVRDMWQYGVTEMINNAIDHSEGSSLIIDFSRTAIDTELSIIDDGEGIFHRIQRLTGLYDPRESILELAKGKLTTDPKNHSGEGIFFTSRAFDRFVIKSRNLYFSHQTEKDDWLIDSDTDLPGTRINLRLSNTCTRNLKDIFDEFSEPDEHSFNKTIVPVRLARHEGEKLVSRSQAKRLVSRFEKFKTVILDFEGVEEIGQAFADEIFRVFASTHPEVHLIHVHVTKEVMQMIERARSVK
jgi:anti-sigma regulatory factor (Ser/Thr protein kinase)